MGIDRMDSQLIRLLEEEGKVLRTGQLDRLSVVAEAKQLLVSRMTQEHLDPASIAEIARLSHRNAALLEAAGSGIRAAHRRLKALREATGPIKSYGSRGQETVIGSENPNVSRKA